MNYNFKWISCRKDELWCYVQRCTWCCKHWCVSRRESDSLTIHRKAVIKALGAETCLKNHGLARLLRGGSHLLISLTI